MSYTPTQGAKVKDAEGAAVNGENEGANNPPAGPRLGGREKGSGRGKQTFFGPQMPQMAQIPSKTPSAFIGDICGPTHFFLRNADRPDSRDSVKSVQSVVRVIAAVEEEKEEEEEEDFFGGSTDAAERTDSKQDPICVHRRHLRTDAFFSSAIPTVPPQGIL